LLHEEATELVVRIFSLEGADLGFLPLAAYRELQMANGLHVATCSASKSSPPFNTLQHEVK
jgi:CelD/BcsL family acetyltransferase involved in cellulose biosynthesis